MTKTLILSVLSLTLSLPTFAWTQVANCGTGDAVAGVDVFTDGEGIIVQILSQDDAQKPTQFKTNDGDVAQAPININAAMATLWKGEPLSFVLSQKDSFSFGGEITKAALLNLKVHTKFSYDHNTTLAYQGRVLSLFCNRPKN